MDVKAADREEKVRLYDYANFTEWPKCSLSS